MRCCAETWNIAAGELSPQDPSLPVTTNSSKREYLVDNAAMANEGEKLLKSVSADSRSGHGLQLHATLWRCERCNSFIAIHSQYTVARPVCPVCLDSIDFCGPLPAVLGLEFADA
jgi:hypothetical protein